MLRNYQKIAFYIIYIVVFNSCKKNESIITIKGNIPNLPNGIMYLCKEENINKIDSVKTVNGKFEFNYKLDSQEPIYLSFHHIDNNNIYSFISFVTKSKYKNGGFNTSVLMSDSLIVINDSIKDNTPKGFENNGKSKFQDIDKISAGYQTNALFHTDGDLFDFIDKFTYKKVLAKIKEYPNSFHLLYQINNTRNSFTPTEIQSFLNAFKGEITKSDTFKTLSQYNAKRLKKSKIELPQLTDNTGKRVDILNPTYKKHLVVFWASWCGPCREEIPALKEVYYKNNREIEFVSVSIDEKKDLWQKALKRESMPWKQLIVTEKSKEYEAIEILFQLSSSVPYVALLDEKMKVIKSHVGLMSKQEIETFLKP